MVLRKMWMGAPIRWDLQSHEVTGAMQRRLLRQWVSYGAFLVEKNAWEVR